MGKAIVTWALLTVFGWVGWNWGATHFVPRLADHYVGITHCAAVAGIVMILLLVTGKLK